MKAFLRNKLKIQNVLQFYRADCSRDYISLVIATKVYFPREKNGTSQKWLSEKYPPQNEKWLKNVLLIGDKGRPRQRLSVIQKECRVFRVFLPQSADLLVMYIYVSVVEREMFTEGGVHVISDDLPGVHWHLYTGPHICVTIEHSNYKAALRKCSFLAFYPATSFLSVKNRLFYFAAKKSLPTLIRNKFKRYFSHFS